jgi:hypothetical protein
MSLNDTLGQMVKTYEKNYLKIYKHIKKTKQNVHYIITNMEIFSE